MTLNLRLLKLSLWLTFLFVGLIFFAQSAKAVSPSQLTSQYGVTYPIGSLSGCKDFADCRSYCEDPVNFTSCATYAKDKGFYVEDKALTADNKLFQQTKSSLGCDSLASCEAVCSDQTNYDKCNKFAADNKLIGGYVNDPSGAVIISKAKDDLGCNSIGSCTQFCSQEANRPKCEQFANETGLRGGNTTEGPGGCTSNDNCQAFCADPNNFNKCSDFSQKVGTGGFTGPGGCASPETCRTYCEQNADNCRSIAPFSSGRYVPVTCADGEFFGPGGACTPVEKSTQSAECASTNKYWTGNNCQDKPPAGINTQVQTAYFQPRPDMGNCATPTGCYDFCKSNPGKCGGFNTNTQRPSEAYLPSIYYTPGATVKIEPRADMGGCSSPGGCYDFCKSNPGKCEGFDAKSPRPLDSYVLAAYYTPPSNFAYPTPPATNYYVTPVYYTPPAGSNYSTPTYYTPGIYSSPSYYTPPAGSNYSTPSYYTPGSYTTPFSTASNYSTPPTYATPRYYTPPSGSNYATPTYYSPSYYTPPSGSSYSTPSYSTPQYYTPNIGGTAYSTPIYYTPPPGSTYSSPSYYTPYSYPTPGAGYSYPSPSSYYSYPTPSGSYSYPTPSTYYTPSSYSYPTPGTPYSYPTPSTYSYPTPSSYSYPTPSAYSTPAPYGTPTYSTPAPYGTPTYSTPAPYNTPPVLGTHTNQSWWERFISIFIR